MNLQDKRVIKTLEGIEKAFLELLSVKPVEKVTVTELADLARINKGTFYLHYQDIPDLYSKIMLKNMIGPIDKADFYGDFFDDPEHFFVELYETLVKAYPYFKTLLQDKKELLFMNQLISKLSDKVYETGRISKNTENDMKLEVIFGSMLILTSRYDNGQRKQATELVVSMIKKLFPGEG